MDFTAGFSGQTVTSSGTELTITDANSIDGDIDDDGTVDITVDANNAPRESVHIYTGQRVRCLAGAFESA